MLQLKRQAGRQAGLLWLNTQSSIWANGGFLNMGTPKPSNLIGFSINYKPSILGYSHYRKPPNWQLGSKLSTILINFETPGRFINWGTPSLPVVFHGFPWFTGGPHDSSWRILGSIFHQIMVSWMWRPQGLARPGGHLVIAAVKSTELKLRTF